MNLPLRELDYIKMLTDMSDKGLKQMMKDALEKEERLWKPLDLSGNTSKSATPITHEHRSDIVEWVSRVAKRFQFYPEAQSLAVSILDKFLGTLKVQTKYLKCVSLTCLYIACKITEEDEIVPHIADLVFQSSANCRIDDIVRMERIILNKLDWNVNFATPLHFLQVCHSYLLSQCPGLLSTVPHITPSTQLAFLTHKLELCMQSPEGCQWSPAMIAVSVLSLELEQFSPEWFPLTLRLLNFIERVNFSELIVCKERFSHHLAIFIQKSVEMAESSRQHKRVRHHTVSSSGKRKMTEAPLDQDDIYASIKLLYNEDSFDEIPDSGEVAAKLHSED